MNDDIDNCRECGHFRFLHSSENNDVHLWRSNQACDPQNDHGCDCDCDCKEYVPEDNLDYVEYLAHKRGLI